MLVLNLILVADHTPYYCPNSLLPSCVLSLSAREECNFYFLLKCSRNRQDNKKSLSFLLLQYRECAQQTETNKPSDCIRVSGMEQNNLLLSSGFPPVTWHCLWTLVEVCIVRCLQCSGVGWVPKGFLNNELEGNWYLRVKLILKNWNAWFRLKRKKILFFKAMS